MTLYSHLEKPLIQHLKEVAKSCSFLFSHKKLVFVNAENKNILQTLAFICGAFHDIGKGTTFFQHYLLNPGDELKGPKNHALISALFVKEFAKEYLRETNLPAFEKKLFTHFVFTAVKRHHGKLNNFKDELDINKKTGELKEQIQNFQESEVQEIIDYFKEQVPINYSWQKFKAYILSKDYAGEMLDFYMDEFTWGNYADIPVPAKINYFYIHQLLYSCLLLSDKTDVILQDIRIEEAALEEDSVDRFRKKKGLTGHARI